jgi:hypothetical protein
MRAAAQFTGAQELSVDVHGGYRIAIRLSGARVRLTAAPNVRPGSIRHVVGEAAA